jgi:hypothetical protein
LKLILPKTLVPDSEIEGGLFFLAGPIKGGDDWQKDCCELLEQKVGPDVTIVNPCRYDEDHPLYRYKLDGNENYFSRQTLWERHYLARASVSGCILFWCPCQSLTNPRKDNQPYARDTYGELGEWRGRLMNNLNLNVVVGAQTGFPGYSVIQTNFNEALKTHFHIYVDLEKAVEAAIQKSQSHRAIIPE